jgi:hypothetical protein
LVFYLGLCGRRARGSRDFMVAGRLTDGRVIELKAARALTG